MPQAIAIALLNGAASPATITFTPVSQNNGVSVFEDRSPGVGSLFRTLRSWTIRPKRIGGVYKTGISISFPVPKVVDGITVPASIARFNGEFIFQENVSDADRKDVYALAKNAFANALLTAIMRDLDPAY